MNLNQMSLFYDFEQSKNTTITSQKEPVMEACASLLRLKPKNYVRTRDGATYRIEGIGKEQKVYTGVEFKTARNGQRYKQNVFVSRERAYCTKFENGKDKRIIIRQEDVIAQSSFLIDLIFKGDYVKTKTHGILHVNHKEIGKVIEYEEFITDGNNDDIKKVKKHMSKTYLLCDKSRKVLYEADLVGLMPELPFDYANYLEDGMEIKCAYWGWVTVRKVMSKKAWCSCNRINQSMFVYFDDIIDVVDPYE